jgi:thymidylate synthase (FAD)
MLARPFVDLTNIQQFLAGFDQELGFQEYLRDPTQIPDAEALCKFAGQLCYLSFSSKRTWNHEISKYLRHIKESGHGSVLEHVSFSFLLYGISRSLTHELVRHRAGAAFSQVSQRFVDGSALRFVERPEFQTHPVLHLMFEERIDNAAKEYAKIATILYDRQLAGDPQMSGERKTDLRKKVNQAARACLPNETEAPIVVSLNVRALRHVLEMRAAVGAETEIRRAAYLMYECVKEIAPILFEDYEVEILGDGTKGLRTAYRKV